MIKLKEFQVEDIKPNPFKKEINGGRLHEALVEKMVESLGHGTLPELFTVRVVKGVPELCFGHHRLEAVKRVRGASYKISCSVVDYTDEMMLVDMVRENLSQRSDDFREEVDSVVLVRKYLQEKFGCVESAQPKYTGRGGDHRSAEVGCRQIAEFLSKDGKMICPTKISTILRLVDKLDESILDEVKKADHSTIASGVDDRDFITVYQANMLTRFDKEEQKRLAEVLKAEPLDHKSLVAAIQSYENAPDEIKEKVLNREIRLADVDDAILDAVPVIADGNNPAQREVHMPSLDAMVTALNKKIIELYRDIESIDSTLGGMHWDKARTSFNPDQKRRIYTFLGETRTKAQSLLATIDKINKTLDERI